MSTVGIYVCTFYYMKAKFEFEMGLMVCSSTRVMIAKCLMVCNSTRVRMTVRFELGVRRIDQHAGH